MSDLIILKLGGSILSLKQKNKPIFRIRIANRIIGEIKRFLNEKSSNLLIVLGTGSFGHPMAKDYKLAEGLINSYSIEGFAKSKRRTFLLNNCLWNLFEQNNIPTITIQTSAITRSKNGWIETMDTDIIVKMLKMGLVVVMFGDEVFDYSNGFSILSSDQIATYLAYILKPQRLLFATDIDGVYDKNPKIRRGAKKIKILKTSGIIKLAKTMKLYNPSDVSGEMAGKLTSIARFLPKSQVETRIFNGLVKNNTYKALIGQPVGTLVVS